MYMYCDRDTFFLCNKNGLLSKAFSILSVGRGGGLNSDIWSEIFSSESFMDLHLDTSLYSGKHSLLTHWMDGCNLHPPPFM